jgi:hypothetical protein
VCIPKKNLSGFSSINCEKRDEQKCKKFSQVRRRFREKFTAFYLGHKKQQYPNLMIRPILPINFHSSAFRFIFFLLRFAKGFFYFKAEEKYV